MFFYRDKKNFKGHKLVLHIGVLLSVFATISTQKLFAHNFERHWANQIGDGNSEVEYSVGYFKSSGRYENDGSLTKFTSNEKFTSLNNDFIFRYGIGRTLQCDLSGRYRVNNASNAVNQNLTNSGMESFGLGIKYFFPKIQRFSYAFEANYRQSAYSNDVYPASAAPRDRIILGDDGKDISAGAIVTYQFSNNIYLSAKGLYALPANDLSQEIRYDFESSFIFKKVGIDLGISGIYSMLQDDYTDAPREKPSMSTYPTNLYNSVNREFMMPYIRFNLFVINKLKTSISLAQTVNGYNTDKGAEAKFTIIWNFGKGKSEESKKINAYKEYGLEGEIVDLSPRKKFVKINLGLADEVVRGMQFDVYRYDYFGKNELVASGFIHEVGAKWSILRIDKMYMKVDLERGFAVRAK